ncbi:hypothetical protein P153DRAFT_281094 [Dothidotthia symphoricarpi CBS 119687]|uniref:LCCL domain-containing protein n=1 Tax=Dothidotthia symphoricarpi CBS 119687 TaxID=1392245 RepID=A0A6A6AQ50_9PLEO|nr:uncharacterized protein P153DRAFT_281094 [Dothidotthia symphoricarpi CBS 119687]KAF2133920.1 hypothetical protein P153DRAFT_281094 [Dothidotthia symphoricarpi CBS 119687]
MDVERGVNQITPSDSPDESRSKLATPDTRQSLDVEDVVPRNRSFFTPRWKKIEQKVPPPVIRCSRKVVSWVKGPDPPRAYRIDPFFERVQTFPARTVTRLPKLAVICVYCIACLLWIVLFGVIISDYSLPSNIGGLGAPVRLSCVAQLWPNPQSCGLDGRNCLPFDDSAFPFNCPAGCTSAQVLNPRAIGDKVINYRSLVVGGASDVSGNDALIYRGDSFICAAAIHVGVITNGKGGCGVVSLLGEKVGYGSIQRNGILSVGFDAAFPMSFGFNQTRAVVDASSTCKDPRWDLLILSVVFSALFSLFASSPAAFFAPIFTILFFQIAMASDPPPYSNYPALASTTLGRFLPAAFAMALMYRFSVRKTLLHCRAHIETTVLWLGGAWVGAMSPYTFEKIPLQRLTTHDLHQQPGAVTALVIIVLVLFAIALFQAWCLRREGRLPRYLGLYAILGLGLLLCLAIPRLSLRIHHYILALLLLPGTALQTRASLLCQGILVGLFINGIARWGFDPILQTAAALQGDAQLGSGIPTILVPVINSTSITFAWTGLLRGYDGVSVFVNDVERVQGANGTFTWSRGAGETPDYFRFGFVRHLPFGGISYSDFTRAGVWWRNGTWSGIPAGRT